MRVVLALLLFLFSSISHAYIYEQVIISCKNTGTDNYLTNMKTDVKKDDQIRIPSITFTLDSQGSLGSQQIHNYGFEVKHVFPYETRQHSSVYVDQINRELSFSFWNEDAPEDSLETTFRLNLDKNSSNGRGHGTLSWIENQPASMGSWYKLFSDAKREKSILFNQKLACEVQGSLAMPSLSETKGARVLTYKNKFCILKWESLSGHFENGTEASVKIVSTRPENYDVCTGLAKRMDGTYNLYINGLIASSKSKGTAFYLKDDKDSSIDGILGAWILPTDYDPDLVNPDRLP